MAIIHRMSRTEIRSRYTHYGLLYGCIPVYVDMRQDPAPEVAVRNWLPDWLMDVGDLVFMMAVHTMQAIRPDYEPEFFIKLTGKIEDSAPAD